MIKTPKRTWFSAVALVGLVASELACAEGPSLKDTGLEKLEAHHISGFFVPPGEDLKQLGLNEDVISERMTQTLRSVGIKMTQNAGDEVVYIYVHFKMRQKQAFTVEVGVRRSVMYEDLADNIIRYIVATVWHEDELGILSADSQEVNRNKMLLAMDRLLRLFAMDYGKVNEKRLDAYYAKKQRKKY